MVWLPTVCMKVSAWRPGSVAAALTVRVFRLITAVIWRVAVPNVPVDVIMTMPLVSVYLPPASTAWPVSIPSPA